MPPSHVHSSYSLSLFVTLPLPPLLFPNLHPFVSINTPLPSRLLPSSTTSSLSLLCITFFLSVSVRLSLLTMAIIKSCPVRYVAHGCYWCPFITHYRWVPVLVLTGHKLPNTHTRLYTHTHCCTHLLYMDKRTHTTSTATDSRKMEDCFTQLTLQNVNSEVLGDLPVA